MMKASRIVLIALGTVGASALVSAYWISFGGSRATEARVSDLLVPISSDPGIGHVEAPGSEPALRVPLEPVAGDAVKTLEKAALELEAAKVFEQDDRTVADKYAGASLPQLLAALALLSERRDAERERIGKQLIDAGRLVLVTDREDGAPSTRGPNPDGSPITSVDRFEVVDGVAVHKSVTITGQEFPEYRALELEAWWLQCRVHTLKQSSDVSGR